MFEKLKQYRWYIFTVLFMIVGGFISNACNCFLLNEALENKFVYCAIIGMVYPLLCGFFEAHYYHYENTSVKPNDINEHPLLWVQRLCVYLTIWQYSNDKVIVLCLACAFSFLHNGMYYTTRHRIDNTLYGKTWFDQSTTSTAITTKVFNPIIRTALFIFALCAYTYTFLNR